MKENTETEFIDNRCRDRFQLETKSRKKKFPSDIGEKTADEKRKCHRSLLQIVNLNMEK